MQNGSVSDQEFCTSFTYSDALGLGYESGATRRDPSPVIDVDGLYCVWYSKSTEGPSGYHASVWYATSPDGRRWVEQGEAICKGESGAWDENGVFTPTILIAEGRYFLFYTAVPKPFDNDNGGPGGTRTAIGVAAAGSPEGPWTKYEENPVLRPGNTAVFDSHRVDDACMIVREGRCWMYYKGRELGLSPGETKMGLAIADRPMGPYVKHSGNPVLGSGHEVCVWPHREGVAALIAPVGPQGRTVQYSADGIHFERKAEVTPPSAPGPYRADRFADSSNGPGITWGLCQNCTRDWPFLVRFDGDLRAGTD